MPKKSTKSTKTASKPAVKKKAVAKKSPAKASRSARVKPKPAAKKARGVIAVEEISLRAYYIGERRRSLGLPGDSQSDWLEAERQILG